MLLMPVTAHVLPAPVEWRLTVRRLVALKKGDARMEQLLYSVRTAENAREVGRNWKRIRGLTLAQPQPDINALSVMKCCLQPLFLLNINSHIAR